MKGFQPASIAFLLAATTSCASIIKGSSETVDFNSSPSGAMVTVRDDAGKVVGQNATPCSIDLKRGAGYFSKAKYDVEFALEGYPTQSVHLGGSVNNWYILGNLVFGGLIGYLIVDPLSGGMFTLARDTVNVSFGAAPTGG